MIVTKYTIDSLQSVYNIVHDVGLKAYTEKHCEITENIRFVNVTKKGISFFNLQSRTDQIVKPIIVLCHNMK